MKVSTAKPGDPWDRRNLRQIHEVVRRARVLIPGRMQQEVDVLRVEEKLGGLLIDFGNDTSASVRWIPGDWEVK